MPAKKSSDQEKFEELKKKADDLKKVRDDLNKKVRNESIELRKFYDSLHDIVVKAKAKKKERDKINKQVSHYKDERDKINKDISEAKKKLSELKGKTSSININDYKKIKKEYESLNWTLQTSPLTRTKENAIIKRLTELESGIAQYQEFEPVEKDVTSLNKDVKKLQTEADAFHKLLLQSSNFGKKLHSEMHDLFDQANKQRDLVKGKEEQFIKFREDADKIHNEFINVVNDIRKYEKKLGIASKVAKDKKIEEIKLIQIKKEKEIMDELRKGKVITTEDLMFLQEGALD